VSIGKLDQQCVQLMLTSNSMVCMTSLAFGIVGLICCALCKDVDRKMNNKVSFNHSP
jgi:hypothetical protein